MRIDTYFGFFAESVFTAIATGLTQQLGRTVSLAGVSVRGTNVLKLKASHVQTVLIPELAERVDVPFLFALGERDSASLARLAGARGIHAVMEQALAAAVEPFNFMTKTRNRLRSVNISRNVTGLTAYHLGGAIQYTMAVGRFQTGATPLLSGGDGRSRRPGQGAEAGARARPEQTGHEGGANRPPGPNTAQPQGAASSARGAGIGAKADPARPGSGAGGEAATGFSVAFLVSAEGRDLIESRATQQATQRALFTISSGAYIARPQWEPPPPPPGIELGTGLSEAALNGWVQSFFGLNDGLMANRLFQRPAGWTMQRLDGTALESMLAGAPITVVRLQLDEDAGAERPREAQPAPLEAFVLMTPKTKAALMQLSKSGKSSFLGDLFRAVFGESAQIWERFVESGLRWKTLAVGDIPADALDAVTSRLAGGGFALAQAATLDDAVLTWAVAVPPHLWRKVLSLTARGVGLADAGAPNRQVIYDATGWGRGRIPWERLVPLLPPQALDETARLLGHTHAGTPRQIPYIVAVAQALGTQARSRWMTALPSALREQAQRYAADPAEGARLLETLTGELVALYRQKRIPAGRLSAWLAIYIELEWARRAGLLNRILPLRHMVYGIDRSSLSRLVYDAKDAGLASLLAWADFPVVDQVRRAVTPGFAMRLLEDVASRRPRTTAYAAQEAQLAFYRRAATGAEQGRYLIRKTPAERLRQVLRLLDGPRLTPALTQ